VGLKDTWDDALRVSSLFARAFASIRTYKRITVLADVALV